MSAFREQLKRLIVRKQRCVDCRIEIKMGWRCEACAADPDPSNGHTGICAVPTCGAEVPVSEYWCQACELDYRADEAADLWHDARGGR